MITHAASDAQRLTHEVAYMAGSRGPSYPPLPPRQGSPRLMQHLEKVWCLQRGLAAPRDKLNALVLAALAHVDVLDQARELGPWVDMLKAIQHAIDGDPVRARGVLQEQALPTGRGHDQAQHGAPTQVVGLFFVGLLELADLAQSAEPADASPASIADHLSRHRRAQSPTLRRLEGLAQAGEGLPASLQALVHMITVFIDALYDRPSAQEGYFHILGQLAAGDELCAECLLIFGFTQLCHGKLQRAKVAFLESSVEALKRNNRLLSALATTELLHLMRIEHNRDNSQSFHDALGSILGGWRLDVPKPPSATHAPTQAATQAGDLPAPAHDIKRAQRIQLAVGYIEQHLCEKFTASQLADLCGVATRTLTEDFRVEFGKTLHNFVTDSRMRLALQLLCEGTLPLKDIASRVGFHSVLGFSKAFVRTYGHSPMMVTHVP